MKTLRIRTPTLATAALLAVFAALPTAASACSVCFGDPASPMVKGAKMGVIFLAVTIYAVLFTMAGVVFYWIRRARALERENTEAETA
jgi:heme/copper-type cytochrome/quinol oxidase subunit 2